MDRSSEMTSLPAQSHRLKLKKPLDVWSTREKLCLASAVFKIGDQNWVSVSRTIKPYVDPNRPADWFHQRNCLLQYYDMMEQLEQPKRKRGSDKCESESASLQIMRNMTIERSEQLKKEILDMQQAFKTLKSEVEAIKAGQWDDKIKDVWEEIQEELKANEKKVKQEMKSEDEDDELKTDILNLDIPSGDFNDSKQEPLEDISTLQMTDEELQQLTDELDNTTSTNPTPSTEAPNPIEITAKFPVASHLLSSLLKSDVKSATELQKLKNEQEQVQSQNQLSTVQEVTKNAFKSLISQDDSKIVVDAPQSIVKNDNNISCPSVYDKDVEESNSLDELIALAGELASETTKVFSQPEVHSSIQVEETLDVSIKEETIALSQDVENQDSDDIQEEQFVNNSISQMVDNQNIQDEPEKEETETPMKKTVEAAVSETDLPESSVKDEAPSPTSSICSRVSEPGSKRGRQRGRPRGSKSAQLSVKKTTMEEDKKVVVSDVDSDEDRSDDPLTGQLTSINALSVLSESFPNSPASMSICSDTEEEKSLKQWKKSIMLVWRAAATHKYANVFLHPVTDEIAPGYRSVVHRPMDLSTIKKNVEMGSIRTTVEFQRDMMLMFTNAIMYNSINHDVYKMAKEMYDDVMLHIEQYVNTQLMIQTTDAKNLRQSRRTDTSDKEDDVKKRRLSVDQSEGGKIKKRKTRLDESMSKLE